MTPIFRSYDPPPPPNRRKLLVPMLALIAILVTYLSFKIPSTVGTVALVLFGAALLVGVGFLGYKLFLKPEEQEDRRIDPDDWLAPRDRRREPEDAGISARSKLMFLFTIGCALLFLVVLTYFTSLAIVGILFVIGVLAAIFFFTKGKEKKYPDHLYHWSPVFTLAPVILFNLLLWVVFPTVYNYIWNDSWRFYIVNFALLLALCLFLIPKKTKDDKDLTHVQTIARKVSKALLAFVAFAIVVMAWEVTEDGRDKWVAEMNPYKSSASSRGSMITKSITTDDHSYGAPVEVALRVIADCESGDGGRPGTARQFEDDEVTPLKNREGSSAFGKYQFLEEHRKRATDLGYDLNTEPGQDAYARFRYSKTGTADWEHDRRSKACWEPRLRGFMMGGGQVVNIVIETPVEDWSDVIPTQHAGSKVDIYEFDKKYKTCYNWDEAKSACEAELSFPAKSTAGIPKMVRNFRFQSLEKEKIFITAKFY